MRVLALGLAATARGTSRFFDAAIKQRDGAAIPARDGAYIFTRS